jgi:glucose/mannose transport system permease protein
MKKLSFSKIISKALIYFSLFLMAFLFIIPLAVMLITSLKSPQELVNVFALPRGLYLGNFQAAMAGGIGRGMINSLCITLPAVFFSTMLGAIAAYPLSQFKFRGAKAFYMILLAGLFVPFQSQIIPLYQLVRTLGLYDSFLGLWVVHTVYGIPICTFYMRNYFATIPASLLGAAIVDGCSLPGYFFRILIKLGKPGLATVIVLQSRSIWNDLLFGLLLTQSAGISPVTVKLATYVGQMIVQYGPLMAATLISIVPTVAIFLIFKRAFIGGILAGSVKS